MSKFVLDGVTFDLENASVSNVNGAWVVNTKQVEKPELNVVLSAEEYKREKQREYQRRYAEKRKSMKLDTLEIPTLASNYESNIVEKLPYGSVAKQIRDNFKIVNTLHIVRAHATSTIYSAFNKNGWGAEIVRYLGNNSWEVIRTR